jgi:hypothetical protein
MTRFGGENLFAVTDLMAKRVVFKKEEVWFPFSWPKGGGGLLFNIVVINFLMFSGIFIKMIALVF